MESFFKDKQIPLLANFKNSVISYENYLNKKLDKDEKEKLKENLSKNDFKNHVFIQKIDSLELPYWKGIHKIYYIKNWRIDDAKTKLKYYENMENLLKLNYIMKDDLNKWLKKYLTSSEICCF